MRRILLVLVLAGCASGERRAASREDARGRVEEAPADMAAHFAYGQKLERSGDLEGASSHYGLVAVQTPAGKFTRPWLSFGRVEHALGRDVSARQALEEVLATVPEAESFYRENEDYREAAVILGAILTRAGEREAIERLRERYVGVLGGSDASWVKAAR